jgi:RNA polymerase sigma factor (sigma-70 family)
LQDQSASEDLVQQTFVKAFMSLDNYQTGRDFGAWLRTIARNLLRNELRRRGREDKNLSRYSRWPYSSVHNAMGKCGCSRRLKTQLSLPKY